MMHLHTNRYRGTAAMLLALCLLIPSLGVIISRSKQATPNEIKDAARFLNQHDPEGPSQIYAPGLLRNHIQAYVAGCPRFKLTGNPKIKHQLPPTPQTATPLSRDGVLAWTGWLRNIVTVDGLQVNWYGENPTKYTFVIQGNNGTSVPSDAQCVYQQDTVQIYQH
jgi:hypothetical protein